MQKTFTFLKSLTFVLTFAFALSLSVNAQQLPNASFENWHDDSTWGPQPDSWSLSNVSQAGFNFAIGERTTDAHTGSYAVKCQDKEVGAMSITAVSPSWITLGEAWAYLDGLKVSSATAGTTGGIAWSYRPDTLAVWIKRSSAGNEDINLVYYSWHGTAYNNSFGNKAGGCTTTDRTDEESDICKSDANTCKTAWGDAVQVAQGWLRSRATYGNWTLVKVPIKYFNNDAPTKMNIILSASNYPNKRANDGLYTTSIMYIDDVQMIYSSKAYEMSIGGYAYSKFNKDQLEYTYEIEGTTIPSITCKRSDRNLTGNEISIVNGVKDGAPTTVTIKAEDGSSTTTYKIYFVSKRDSNPYPATIKVNGTVISGFNAYVNDYTVGLPYGTTENPVIDVVKANDKQTVTIAPYTVPGVAKVTVTAENPDYSVTYNINFTINKLSDTTLKSILVNGIEINGYSPTKTVYKVDVPVGTTESPEITYVSAYPEGEQTVVIDRKGVDEVSTVTVSAPGATTSRVYKISYNITESTYSQLKDIKVDGVSIPGFAPATLNYVYPLPLGTTTAPVITYVAGDAYQTIVKEDAGIDGTTKITVTAQNGINTSVYRVQMPLTKSSNSKLKDLLVGGVSLEGFAPDITSYSYTLPVGTEVLPEITWVKGDEYQSVKVTLGGLNGTTKVVVTAQDGSVTIYSIKFSVVQATNSTLKDIQLDGVSLEGFAPEITSYSILLPRGTKVLPVITYTPYDSFQKITKIEGGVNGVTRITVKAQSGDVTVYALSFSVEKSDYSYLADIKVGGSSIEGFAPATLEYDYELEAGTTELPAITYVLGDEYQKVSILKGGVNGVTTLKVTAESGVESTYSINFSVKKSANANLKNIFLDGVALDGFDPNVYSYTYALAEDAQSSPVITVEKEATQSVSITKPMLYGTAYIYVLPEDGSKNIYTIKFVSSKGSNCNLTDIKLDGETIDGFDSNVTSYSVVLPQGTTQLPSITWTKAEDSQKVEMQEGGLNGTTEIIVLSENGSTKTYSIKFSTLVSSDGLLSDIKVDGVSLEGFAPDVYEYTYMMDKTEKVRPAIQAVKSNEFSRLHYVLPYSDGDAKFYVTSEDGTQSSLYTVHFVYEVDTNALLADILVDGSSIGLKQDQFAYTIDVPVGVIPTISYVKSNASQVVLFTNVASGASLHVIAENGANETYTITYNVVVSSNAALQALQVYDEAQNKFVTIDGFASDKYEYTITLPKSQTDVNVLNCIGAAKNQTYVITYGGIGGETTVDVIAEDGETTSTYKVKFIAEKSSVCTLDEISVDEVPLAGFDPEVTVYDFPITESVAARGALAYVKSDASATVQVVDDVYYNASVITVTAEDGTQKVYTINFKRDFAGKPNRLKGILIDGNMIEGFSPDVYEYTIPTTVGAEVPEITYEKNYYGQTVYTAYSGRNTFEIVVKSNQDGVADVTYKVNFTQTTPSEYNVLSALYVNGNALSDFQPNKYKYVLQVTSKPTITVSVAAGGTATKSVDKGNHIQFTTPVNGSLKSVKYDIYLHYTSDVIPNSKFETWEKTTYQVGGTWYKPTGWMALSDVRNSKYAWTVYCGPELTMAGDSSVNLATSYWAALASAIPAVMSINTPSISFGVAGTTSVSFSGNGVAFRNTPDKALVKYKQRSKAGNGFKVTFGFYDGSSTSETSFSNGDESSDYVTGSVDLNTDGKDVKKLNIIANATGQTKGASSGANVYLKSLDFSYSSKIAGVKVNGSAVTFNGNSGTVTISREFTGVPVVDITGEVSDQMYDMIISDEVEGRRNVTIRSYAEDLTYTDYSIVINRPVVSSQLQNILIGGETLSGFSGDVYNYSVYLPVGNHYIPDVVAVGSSSRQKVSMSSAGNVVTIKSVSDVDEERTYTITFIEDDLDKAELTSLVVNGYDIAFDPATEEYSVTLDARTKNLPDITYGKISDKQKVVLTEGGVNGTTTVAVTSADKSVEKTYSIKFSVAEKDNTTSKLGSMSVVDAMSQIAFDADVFEYTYTKGEQDVAYVNYSRAFFEDSMVVTINSDSVVWKLKNPLSSTENEYKLKFTNDKSSNSHLADIKVCGVSIEDFNPNLTEYAVTVDRVSTFAIDPVLAEEGQTIETTFEDDTFTFVVTAADGEATTTYSVAVSKEIGTSANLSDIKLDGVTVEDFDAETYSYNVTLPEGATLVPEISAFCESEGETPSMDIKSITEVSQIDLESEDGKTQQSYYLNFNVPVSDDATLIRISADMVALEDFDPEVFDYVVSVPFGKENPLITFEKGNAAQTVNVEKTTEKVEIEVVSESGLYTNIYKVVFDKELATGSSLANITLDGETLPDFASDKYEYSVELPAETTVLPLIETVSGDYGQVVIVTTNGVRGDAIIDVTSQDGQSSSVYTIHFSVAKSENSFLNMIRLDGQDLEGFASETFDYNVTLEEGRTTLPEVTWVLGQENQVVTKTENDNLVVLEVTSEKGNKSEYTIDFEIVLSKADTLKMIYVNAEEIPSFKPSVFDYTVTLPLGTDVSKVNVDYQTFNSWQTVGTEKFDGGVKFIVTAQDKAYQKTYTVNLEVEKSTNTRLADIMADGLTIDGFDPEKFQYEYTLPMHTTVIPAITYTAGDEYQVVEENVSEDKKNVSIKVSAQNGDYSIYSVEYYVIPSDNANLKSITLGDERQLIPSFDEGVYTYSVVLPYGTKTVPAIDYEKAEEAQTVETNYTTDVNGTSTITVTAEDGVTTQTYIINFFVADSNVSTLNMIYYNGNQVPGFAPDDNDYVVFLPYGTTVAPVVTYDLTEPENETAEVSPAGTIPDGWHVTITVFAKNGDVNEYELIFKVEKDKENRLSDIKVFGKTIADFDKDVTNYDIVLPAYSDSALIPYVEDVEYVKMSENESVVVRQPARESIILEVTSQNGDVRNYVIKTTISLSSNTQLDAIYYKGVLIPDFESDVYEYTYKLPFGTNTVDQDSIEYVAQESGEVVMVSKNGMDVEVQVTAQDDETRNKYIIHFVPDEFDPNQLPAADQVCITSLSDGGWKFTTRCSNVNVVLTDLSGKVLVVAPVPVADPNCPNLCGDDVEGFVYYAPVNNLVAYSFIYALKSKVASGKFKGF